MNGKQVIKKLKDSAWVLDRITGSHHVMMKDGIVVPVPVHGAKDIGDRSDQENRETNRSEVTMNVAYPYTLEPQETGGYLVQFVDLDNAFTEGETQEEAAFNAAEVLTAILESRLAHDQPIPQPSVGEPVAYPSAALQAALLLRQAREEQGRTLAELARGLNTSWPAAQRLESANNNPTLKQLERAAAVLGKRLVVQLTSSPP